MTERRGKAVVAALVVLVLAGAIGAALLVVARGPASPGGRAAADVAIPEIDGADMEPRVAARFRQAREAIQADPDSAEAWGRLGMVSDVHALHDTAIVAYERAYALEPGSFRWPYFLATAMDAQGQDVERIIALFEEARAKRPEYPDLYVRLGDALVRQGRTAEAIEAYRTATDLNPSLAVGWRGLGQALIGENEPARAIDALERADELVADDAATWSSLARAYRRAGRDADAEAASRRMADLERTMQLPDPARDEISAAGISSAICSIRANRLMGMERWAEAIEQLEIVEEVNPRDAVTLTHLGNCHYHLGDVETAVQYFLKSIEHDDSLLIPHLRLGSLSRRNGHLDRAEMHFRRAVENGPESAAAHALLGSVLAQRRKLPEAVEAFERSAALDEPGADVLLQWGTALVELGEVERGLGHLERAVDLDPTSADAFFNLGFALEELGRVDGAIRAYRAALRIDRNHRAGRRLAGLGVAP